MTLLSSYTTTEHTTIVILGTSSLSFTVPTLQFSHYLIQLEIIVSDIRSPQLPPINRNKHNKKL